MNNDSKINLDSLFTKTFKVNEKNIDIISFQVYNALQCQCARSIYVFLESISKFIEVNWLEQQHNSDKFQIPNLMIDLQKNVHLTMNLLFKIIDLLPILKQAEPFFFKSLLMIHLYFDKLFVRHVNITFENLDILSTDENMKYKKQKIRNNDSTSKNVATEYVINVTDHTIDNDDIAFLTNLTSIFNIVKQMINLIERFIFQTCNDPTEQNIDYDFQKFSNEHLKSLIDLDNQINFYYPSIVFTVFDIKKVLLSDFFLPVSNDLNKLRPSSVRYITEASIILTSNKGQKQNLPLNDIFKKTVQHYKIEVVYEYLKSVYDVQLKIVYHKINEIIYNIINSTETENVKVYMNSYSTSLKKLQLINVPIDLINEFNILLKIGKLNIIQAKNIVERRLENLSHVLLPDKPEFISTTLDEIIESISNHEFKQFWWVFNLLHREAAKKSDYVYEVSLKFALVNSNINGKIKSNFICESFKNIYINFFRFEHFIQNIMSDDSTSPNDVQKLIILHTNLAHHLSQVIKIFSNLKYLYYGDDFLKILIAVIIHLRNTKNIEFDICSNELCSDSVCIKETVNSKLDKIVRIGNLIINLLDNYQLCNCAGVNNRYFYFEYYQNIYILFNNYRIDDSILYITNIPTAMPIKTQELSNDTDIELSLNEQGQFSPEEKYKMMDTIQPTITVPSNFYDLSYLAESNIFKNEITFLSTIYFITFNWYGQIIPFSSLDMSKSIIISLYRLVDYQRLIFKWIISLFYTVWIVIFEHRDITATEIDEEDVFIIEVGSSSSTMFNYLDQILSMKFDDPFETYIIGTIIAIYNNNLSKTLSTFQMLRIIMIEQMKSFYVVDINKQMKDLKDLIKSKNTELHYEEILLNQCINNFETYINTLKKHLIFLK